MIGIFMNKSTKDLIDIVGKLGKDISIIEAEVMRQWYDKLEGWKTYNVERKQGNDVQSLINSILKKESLKKIEPVYNDENKKIGYIFSLPDRKFVNESESHKERIIVIFYKQKYDYLEVD